MCPECNSDGLPDNKYGRIECEQCLSRFVHTIDNGLKVITLPKHPIDRGEITMENGKISRKRLSKHSRPHQPIYEINRSMYMDCVGCSQPAHYLSMVRGRMWDHESTIKLEKVETQFVINRLTVPSTITKVMVDKTITVPMWIHGWLCESCVSNPNREVHIMKSDYDVDIKRSPDMDRHFPKGRVSKANVRVKPRKPTYTSRG